MSQTAEVLKILIASPSDVAEERDVVEKVIRSWNDSHFETSGVMLYPMRWESHAYPASGGRPQSIINKQIVSAGDILIGIFGYKLGTPTGAAQSGTIEEIEEFRKAGKYVALYFSTADVPRNADWKQLEALEAYRKDRQADTLYFQFQDALSLKEHLTRHLPRIIEDARAGHRQPVVSLDGAGEITTPRDGSDVGALVKVTGRTERVEPGAFLWLAVGTYNKVIYPQCHLASNSNEWEQSVRIGRIQSGLDTGMNYSVQLVLVDSETHRHFSDFIMGKYPSMDGYSAGGTTQVHLLDSIRVIRVD